MHFPQKFKIILIFRTIFYTIFFKIELLSYHNHIEMSYNSHETLIIVNFWQTITKCRIKNFYQFLQLSYAQKTASMMPCSL